MEAELAPPRIHVQAGMQLPDGSEVARLYLAGWNPLLGALIRQVPGAQWHRPGKCHLIPAALTAEAVDKLRGAGADVTVDEVAIVKKKPLPKIECSETGEHAWWRAKETNEATGEVATVLVCEHSLRKMTRVEDELLPPTQAILAALQAHAGQTGRELTEATGLRRSTVSQALAILRDQRQVKGEQDKTDERSWRWHLTELSKVARPSKRRRF